MKQRVVIIQPPLVQLNAPYPSGAYLSAFFKNMDMEVEWHDMSLELYSAIFSKEGLHKLFEKTSITALKRADEAEKKGDKNTAFNLRRYISERDNWENWISPINAILTSGSGQGSNQSGREFCHRFIFSPHAPRGYRMQQYLDNLGREPTTDDARGLASLALADLADYITIAFDSNFSLIRYAESLTINETHFSQIEKAIDSPTMDLFYNPLLKSIKIDTSGDYKTLICISIPFPGTFTAGLYTGRYFKEHYGKNVFICMGGGFINTELRNTTEPSLNKYIDAISYDRGYGSYHMLFNTSLLDKKSNCKTNDVNQLFKMRLFLEDGIVECKEHDEEAEKFEQEQTEITIPDFSDIDFSRYPRLVDDTNSMHRLWSDGTWLRAYLAHGCYWHKCAFCDVTLDYVCSFHMTHIPELFHGLYEQALKKGIYGIHFVDEASPPVALARFALENSRYGNELSYWGNVRFEKTFTKDIANFLSYGGLIGVSGGIEIATGNGLDDIHKGTDIDSIVGACAAFKETGILVHAYMIFGYWEETPQMLIDSMETLRQFFEAGLIDSAFWHKFVLTRHSRIYKEWKEGKYKNLKPIIPNDSGIFAKNGLHFEGENKSDRYEEGLNNALNAWMHGQGFDIPVRQWFNFKMPSPSIPKNYIEQAIDRYTKRCEEAFNKNIENTDTLFWIAGIPVIKKNNNNCKISWIYMQEEEEITVATEEIAEKLCYTLKKLRPSVVDSNERQQLLENISHKLLQKLRGRGLCVLPSWKILEK